MSFAFVAAYFGDTNATANGISVTSIMFFINLGLTLCAMIEVTALIVLYKKTVLASVMGLATIISFGFGAVLFFIQLLMYSYHNKDALYVVSFCLTLLYASFIMSCIYFIMLSRNSHKALCIATGILALVPPIGIVFAIRVASKLKRDTPMQELVYNGYAYTYAALGDYCQNNKPEFIDMAGEEAFAPLTKKERKRKLKALKKNAKTAEGMYAYASAIVAYTPENSKKAVKLMTRAAACDFAPALFNLGYYCEVGAYVKKDVKKAKGFYARAASGGDEDAALRLGIIHMKCGEYEDGFKVFRERAEKGDVCAKYNLGVCCELGIGQEPDTEKALDIYEECIKDGLFTAQKRMFALAATDINSAQNGDFFRKVTDRPFTGSFAKMIEGLIHVKKRHAADAAESFLSVVKFKDKWEGLARCLVGTLYIDRGADERDRHNGAEYIRSAIKIMPNAQNILSVLPRSVTKEIKTKKPAK